MRQPEVVILAGGKGTRLKEVWDGPKALAPISGIPMLAYVLDQTKYCKRIISGGYKGNDIVRYISDTNFYNIDYIYDFKQIGTYNAVRDAASTMVKDDNFLVINADTFFNINLYEFYQRHINSKKLISVAVKEKNENDGNYFRRDSSLSWEMYKREGKSLLNSGVYCVNKKALKVNYHFDSFDKIVRMVSTNIEIYDDFIIDIGTVENYNMINFFYKHFDGVFNRG